MNKSETGQFLDFNITLPEEERRCAPDSRHWMVSISSITCSSLEEFVKSLGGQIAQRISPRKVIAKISSGSWYYEYGPIEIYLEHYRWGEEPPYEFNLIVEEITEEETRDFLKKLDERAPI